MKKMKINKLRLGGGVVNTTRITSKGILFAGKKHYNNEYIQRYRGREVLVHEVDGFLKAYLYEDGGNILGRMLCVHDMRNRQSAEPEYYTERYYQQLIQKKTKPRTGRDQFIQKMTTKDAGLVLACIGFDHPASKEVLRYLADEKRPKNPFGKMNPLFAQLNRTAHHDPSTAR